jgi:uncharacterized protein (TIGR00369 family)
MCADQSQLETVQRNVHPFCVVCSGSNPHGLRMQFKADGDGGVSAVFLAQRTLEGYQGLLHGGVIASMLDGAMTNCLFAHGIVAVTGELNVRYWKPVLIGCELRVRAWIKGQHRPLYFMQAELTQESCVKVAASARFMERNG